jgi:hypothetical protein
MGNNVVHSGKVDNFRSVFLNNQLPVADTISIEICEGKVLVIGIDLDNVTRRLVQYSWRVSTIARSSNSITV